MVVPPNRRHLPGTLPAKLTWVSLAYSNVVQYRAVIFPITGRPGNQSGREALRAAFKRKLELAWRLWRCRVVSLSRLGWPKPGPENKRLRLGPYLCRPSGALAGNKLPSGELGPCKLRFCMQSAVCPFCRMRLIYKEWQRLELAYTRMVERGDVVIFSRCLRYEGLTDLPAWYQSQSRRRGSNAALMNKLLPKGTWAGMEWADVRGRKEGTWIGECRQLWLTTADYLELPLYSGDPHCRVERYPASRQSLCRELAWATRYPVFLMKYPPELVVEVAEGRRKIRTRGAYGLARALKQLEPQE